MENEIWIAPLLLMPGVALLIMSTQARFGQLHGELHHQTKAGKIARSCLRHRARLFRSALIALYGSVCAFTLASMIGAVLHLLMGWSHDAEKMVVFCTCTGILAVFVASVQLVRESSHSLNNIEEHLRGMKEKDKS